MSAGLTTNNAYKTAFSGLLPNLSRGSGFLFDEPQIIVSFIGIDRGGEALRVAPHIYVALKGYKMKSVVFSWDPVTAPNAASLIVSLSKNGGSSIERMLSVDKTEMSNTEFGVGNEVNDGDTLLFTITVNGNNGLRSDPVSVEYTVSVTPVDPVTGLTATEVGA